MRLQQYDTTKALCFLMVLSSDKTTAATGKTVTVTLSKNGGSFVSATGTVAEIANGWYKLTPSAADVGTTGSLALHAEASACEPRDKEYEVVPDRGYLLCATENSSGYYSATTTQYAFTALSCPNATVITGGLKGRLFSIISGTGAGQDRIISSSSVSIGVMILTFETAFEVTPDSTSVWVISRARLPKLDSSLRASVLDSNSATLDVSLLATASALATLAAQFSGITLLRNWLRAILRKDAPDATALSEINSGGGTYDATTDSLEAQKDAASGGSSISVEQTEVIGDS